ncbi:hypothetical protein EYV94_11335 [Puteibacter caeruleilacunae]|nr:hypothetical protein EYV94_11335 [Puteibacter caeruleilacunae]
MSTIKVNIYVRTEEMIEFYKGDQNQGNPQNPYTADPFCNFVITGTETIGANGDILSLQSDSQLQWSIKDADGNDLVNNYNDEIFLSMVTDQETLPVVEDWQKIFNFTPNGQYSVHVGKLLIKGVNQINTQQKISLHNNLQYNIGFSFSDATGKIHYALIDPFIKNPKDPGNE